MAARDRAAPGMPAGARGPPPELDELIARVQNFFRSFIPPRFGGRRTMGRGGGRGRGVARPRLAGDRLASGFYRVQPDELGVVLRFGPTIAQPGPGLN